MAKNYIKGSYKEYKFDNGSKLVASILVEDLQKIANEKGYANIVIQERKETDQYGNTHYATENDWKPEDKKAGGKKAPAQKPVKEELKKPSFDQTDSLPF